MVNTTTPIRFLYKSEILERPNYFNELAVDSSGLSHIVGIFQLEEKDAFMCGLNGCGQKHWHGLVISTKCGRETHCGLDCGKREFPEDFEAKRALFTNALRIHESRETISNLKKASAELVSSLTMIQTKIDQLYPYLKGIRDAIRRCDAAERAFNRAAKHDGVIMAPVELTEIQREISGGQRFTMQSIGRVAGISAISDYAKIASEVDTAIANLKEVGSLDVSTITPRKIKYYVQLNNDIPTKRQRALNFLKSTRLLLDSDNRANIEKLTSLEGIKGDRSERILKAFDELLSAHSRVDVSIN